MMGWLGLLLALAGAPLLGSLIVKTKAWFAGRQGAPLLQPYRDLYRLWHKGAVFSTTTSWLFQLAPTLMLGATLLALTVLPFAGRPGPVSFIGDLVVLAYLLGLGRFLYLLAALDTGSAFAGMGASREAWIGMLAEPGLVLGVAALARYTGGLTLAEIYGRLGFEDWVGALPVLAMVALALGMVLLAEGARMPVDDPTTHLELTMVHEAMVLDHSGPDLAMIHYAADLKLWLFGSLLVSLVLPTAGLGMPLAALMHLGGLGLVALGIGVVESVTGRITFLKLPKFIASASLLAGLALLLVGVR